MKPKTLKYYLGLKYTLRIRPFVDDDLLGWHVTAEELDPHTFYGSGDSPQEALDSFEETKEQLFPHYLMNKLPIPEPK
jgi:predicted RNase H-like HicB family nuclease